MSTRTFGLEFSGSQTF